jgi:hypothetical protein
MIPKHITDRDDDTVTYDWNKADSLWQGHHRALSSVVKNLSELFKAYQPLKREISAQAKEDPEYFQFWKFMHYVEEGHFWSLRYLADYQKLVGIEDPSPQDADGSVDGVPDAE